MIDVEQAIELELRVRGLIREIASDLERAKGEVKPPGKLDGTEGRLSRQDSMLHHEMAKAGLRRRQQRLTALREALVRMDNGNYGICANCGDWISWERLDGQPEALLCGACAAR